MLKIERPKQKRVFFFSLLTFILLLKNPFNYPLLSFPEVRRERSPKPGIPACSRGFAGCRPCVNKTLTRPCDVMMREIQLFWRMGTLTEALLPGGPRCILLRPFKLQIHLKYVSQECSQLKCKPCWVWKTLKKSWPLHLGGLHFHALKRRESPDTSSSSPQKRGSPDSK